MSDEEEVGPGEDRLSRGQKKKLRQQRQVTEQHPRWAPRGFGAPPPGWPIEGAELVSAHPTAAGLPVRCGLLRLAALPFPQPEDPLLWRLFPLVRTAIAEEGDDRGLGAADIAKFVEGRIPEAFLLGLSRGGAGAGGKFKALLSLVLSKNVRRGRLLERGRRYLLPSSEDKTILVPSPVSWCLGDLWVAWDPETKRPRQVALRFQPCEGSEGSSKTAWLSARLGMASLELATEGEAFTVGSISVVTPDAGGSFLWRDARTRTGWSLVCSEFPPEVALELVRECVSALDSLDLESGSEKSEEPDLFDDDAADGNTSLSSDVSPEPGESSSEEGQVEDAAF